LAGFKQLEQRQGFVGLSLQLLLLDGTDPSAGQLLLGRWHLSMARSALRAPIHIELQLSLTICYLGCRPQMTPGGVDCWSPLEARLQHAPAAATSRPSSQCFPHPPCPQAARV